MRFSDMKLFHCACVWLLSVAAADVRAEWVDDWFSSATVNGPSSFNNQQRGFYDAGSFQARFNNNTDYLATIQLPKLKSGCGGIDGFLGGISFLDEDYLVAKMQGMIQAAPAVAFDIALQTMSKSMADTIGKLEAATTWLNNIQLNECAMSKRVVTALHEKDDPDILGEIYGEMTSDVSLSQALSKNYQQEQERVRANNNQPTRDLKNSIDGCPASFRNLFAPGSMLDNAVLLAGMTNYAEIIRGYIGDVEIRANPTDLVPIITPVDRCPTNDPVTLDDMLNGRAQAKNSQALGGNCYQDNVRGTFQIVNDELVAIANVIRTRGTLTAGQITFINNSPVPVYTILKKAIAENNEAMTIASVSNLVASAYTFRIFDDLYRGTDYLFGKADSIATPPGSSGARCEPNLYLPAKAKFERMHKELWNYRVEARKSYLALIDEHLQFMNYSNVHRAGEESLMQRQALDVNPR